MQDLEIHDKKFDSKKLAKLNNPARLDDTPLDYIWEKLNLKDPKVLVDIGAGTAFYSIALLKYAPQAKIYACDISKTMLAWISENVVSDFPNVIPLKSGEAEIPLDDGMADLVFMINLHHELDEPEKLLSEAYRMLYQDGKVLIIDWKKEAMDAGPPVAIRCTPQEVQQQLTATGFRQIEIYSELPKHFMLIAQR
jgi:ubiquinone/menaquinone biosynthesis C-methylase UbiE